MITNEHIREMLARAAARKSRRESRRQWFDPHHPKPAALLMAILAVLVAGFLVLGLL